VVIQVAEDPNGVYFLDPTAVRDGVYPGRRFASSEYLCPDQCEQEWKQPGTSDPLCGREIFPANC